MSNLIAMTEISNMVKLANEAFKCLRVFNLDLGEVYDQVFDFYAAGGSFGCGLHPEEIATQQSRLFRASGNHNLLDFM